MTRSAFPGGSYVEAEPSGAYAALMADHVQTHLGRIPLPPAGAPLYLRMTTAGGFQLCGQASAAYGTLHYHDGAWQLDPRIANGQSGAIFDAQGGLHIIEPGPGVTSQGYRYVAEDGALVLGDATYSSPFGLHEYSVYGGLAIGQGSDGGVKVWDGTVRRVLDEGFCTFVRVRGAGEHVAISYIKAGEGSVIVQTTLSELRALSVVPDSSPKPPTPPTPSPPPPEPEPVPMLDYLSIITAIRQKYPTPLGTDHWKFLVEVAQATGTQLYRKEDSNSVLIPALGKRVSLDIIGRGSLGNQYADILQDSEGAAKPVFQLKSPADGEYVDVSGVMGNHPTPAPLPDPGPIVPNPGTPPPAPSVDLSLVLAAIATLRSEVKVLSDKIPPPAPPPPAPVVKFPDYQGSIPYLGTVTLRPKP